jgi:quinol monooxygenase YgiN
MNTTALFIIHRTKPGMRDAVRSVWMKHMAPAIQANPGHLAYTYSFDNNDPDGICAFQLYSSEAEAKAFLNHSSYLAYLKEVESLLSGPPQIKSLSPQWVKTT